jgi:hypothetical protein
MTLTTCPIRARILADAIIGVDACSVGMHKPCASTRMNQSPEQCALAVAAIGMFYQP